MKVLFNKAEHKYIDTDSNRKIPGVSEIIKSAGMSCAFYNNPEALVFGSTAHEIVALKMVNNLKQYDEQFEPWMKGIELFIKNENPVPMLLEKILFSTTSIPYAGTLDFLGHIERWGDRWCILDWKFWSSKTSLALATAGIQLSAYEELANSYLELGKNVKMKRAVIHFVQDKYFVYECSNNTDINYFRSAINVWYWKEKNGANNE